MKVKLVASTKWSTFENMINEFIKDKKIIDIKFSAFTNIRGVCCDRALIMYEEE